MNTETVRASDLKTLVFVPRPEDAPTLLRAAGDDPIVCAVSGSGMQAEKLLELAFEDLGNVHDLVQRLELVLENHKPERVIGPFPDEGDLDRRAVAAALLVALSRGLQRMVVLVDLEGRETEHVSGAALLALRTRPIDVPRATAVVSTWNKASDVRQNLASLHAQTWLFDAIVVVDNASSDDTAKMIAKEFPKVRLIVMPNSDYGACETFNVGFASSLTELTAILDDDIVMSPAWLEKATSRLMKEPGSTAILSTKIVEPEMPESFVTSDAVNTERYMSTFRGCASLARSAPLEQAGYYDERLFIYGNERDLTCRLLNRGYRVLQYPSAEVFHKTPFGIKMGKRSLYFHARNAWLSMLKYAPLGDLLRMPFLVFSSVLLRSSSKEAEGEVTDATGTIGIGRSLRETPGAWWVVFKAACSVLYNVPYCLKHREPVSAPDFELPLK